MKPGPTRWFARALALFSLLPVTALAGDAPPADCPAIDTPAAVRAPAVRAFRDPVTGRLRAPTAEERTRLSAGRRQKRAAARRELTIVERRDGTKTVALGDAFMQVVRVEKDATGKTRAHCAPDPDAAGPAASEKR